MLSELVADDTLARDHTLARFRKEYEKLHSALSKSHQSESRLIQKCRDLNSEIVSNAAKVQAARRGQVGRRKAKAKPALHRSVTATTDMKASDEGEETGDDESSSCLEEEDVAALIFVGDSVLRSLYASFLDLLGLNAHEKQIKESHKAPALTIGKFHVAFMEFWFHNDIQKVYFRWKKLFEGQMQDVLNQNNRKNPATILLVVNLGVMHQLHGACNDAGGYARTLSSFKSFLAQWYSSLPEENRPRIRGVIYGAPAVLGLRNAGVSFGRGEAITRRAVAALGGRAGSATRAAPLASLSSRRRRCCR